MIEIILILSFLFLIYVFFYKQTTNEYSINQIEYTNIHKLNDLLYDKLPIVVRSIVPPQSLQPHVLLNTPRFQAVLGNYLNEIANTLPSSKEFSNYIANESGFQVYVEHFFSPLFKSSTISNYVGYLQSAINFGSKTLQTTTSIQTVILPIKGNYTCTLINNEFTKYIPQEPINTIEQVHKNIQYIDIKLKPNTCLILPPHWHYIMNEDVPYSYFGIIEYHEPISLLMNYLDKKQ